MNPFKKIAFQGLKKNRARTAVTIVGVVLSAAMFTAIAVFVISLQNYLVNGARAKYGSWQVGFPDVSASFLQGQVDDERVEKVSAFEDIGYAMLEGGKNENKPYLFVAGFGTDTFAALPIELISGRLPENDGEILIPAHVFSNGGVRLSEGDTLSLTVGRRTDGSRNLNQHDPYRSGEGGSAGESLVLGTEKTYTVVGTYRRPVFEENSAPGYTAITAVNAENLGEHFTAIVTLKNVRQVRSYAKSADEGGGYFLNDEVLRFLGLSGNQGFNILLYTAGGILVLLVMVGSVFLIYNSFTISMNDRMRQFGVLLSVGATEKQIRSSVRFEAFCIGLAGIPLGMLAGVLSMHVVLSLVSENFRNILYDTVPLTVEISVPVLAAAALVSMATILISASLPARKALKTPIMECIRQTNEVKVSEKDVKTSRLSRRLYGLEGTLALKNFRRNKRRYRSIVLSLTLSVVLFVAADAFSQNLMMMAGGEGTMPDYDICFGTESMPEEEFVSLYEMLKTADGIYESDYETAGAPAGVGDSMTMGMTFHSESPSLSVEEMRSMLAGAGLSYHYSLVNLHEAMEQNRNVIFVVKLFTVIFVGMLSLIATANVFNTISTNIRLRRRELAMLRSMGMGERDFNKMMCFECIFYGGRTLLFGLPAAGLLSWLIYEVLSDGGMEGTFLFPWKSMGICVFGVFLIIYVTMLYVIRKIKKENIIDTLRDELI